MVSITSVGMILEEANNRCGPLVTSYAAKFLEMLIATIQEEVAAGRLLFAVDVSAKELALAFATAAHGINNRPSPPTSEELCAEYARHVRLLLCGASV